MFHGNTRKAHHLPRLPIALILILLIASLAGTAVVQAAGGSPVLTIGHTVSQEPLLAGQVGYTLTVRNNGATPVTDRAYNLTITDTLPIGLVFVSAQPAPTSIVSQADGTTALTWDNIADLEAQESLQIAIVASLQNTLTTADTFVNQAGVRANSMPDNSGNPVQATSQLAAQLQAIDIEATIVQSTADEQAMGAGEYASAPGRGPGADWVFTVRATVRNNNVGPTSNVVARVTLPAGIAYLGGVVFSSNPNSVSTTPTLKLNTDGSLDLSWSLGTLTTAQHTTPVTISFQAAIPYRFRTAANNAARNGPFAGPMSGAVIAEDTVMPVQYEATGTYAGAPTADGSESTPADDAPAQTTAEILTVHKGASPTTVGIGTEVTYSLTYYVSEYYTVTNGTLVDVLPDGMTYVDGSANLAPVSVTPNSPGAGQTTIAWQLPASSTTPGASATVTFRALVDATYEAAPLAGQPVVSGDSLTNRVTISGEWADAVDISRLGTVTPDTSSATVATRMPIFDKVVRDPLTQQWVRSVNAFVGDTLTFRLTYASAADVDAKEIVIRDYLPRGMTYVNGSATHAVSGTYTNGASCAAAPQSPTVGTIGGLQYLEWKLCNAAKGATWEAQIQAKVGPMPNVQPGWIVANFGKLSGANSYGAPYSQRAMATTNYKAPRLVLTKTATPDRDLQGGSTVTYAIQVTNMGDATAYNLVVTDTVPVSLTVPAEGGSGSPSAAAYSTASGNPAASQGGTLLWSQVASLAPNQTQTFTYQAQIPQGLPAGMSLTNRASVGYNSRPDNQGHPVARTGNIDDDQTNEATVYVKGLTITKVGVRSTAGTSPNYATIGDVVSWTLTVTVPTGVVAYWPVVEENNLPSGFDYVAGSRAIQGATFDDAHHAQNPKVSTDHFDLRFFVNSIDNSAGATPYVFTIRFATLVSGVRFDQPATQYYTNNTVLNNAVNTSYVGWYDKASGYANTGWSWDGFETNRIDRRSPVGRYTIKVRQPYLTLQKAASISRVGAGDIVSYTITLRNAGTDTAYDMLLRDVLPPGLTLLQIDSVQKPAATTVTPTSSSGAAYAYTIDRLDAGGTVVVVYRAQVAGDISSDSSLTNTASVTSYSTKPGTVGDTNGDSVTDERIYTGPKTTAVVHTPQGSIQKTVTADELSYGSTIVYTLTVPGQPINATMYNVVVSDTIDSRLQVINVQNGSANGNTVSAAFGSIGANAQQVIVVTAQLPTASPATPGTLITNRGYVLYDKGGLKPSNYVANTIVAPALVVDKQVVQLEAAAGELVDYTVTVRNVGNGRAENLLLTDTLPANMAFEAGTAQLNGAPFAAPSLSGLALPALPGVTTHTLTYKARMVSAESGVRYLNTVQVTGMDSRGLAIPADASARFAADTDADDAASAILYGPLVWDNESIFVAFEDLKNVGWSDWDYNDFIVKIDVARGKTSSGGVAALRLDYEAMARGAAYDHRFLHRLPVFGGGRYTLAVRNADGQVVSTAAGAIGDEPAIPIFERTKTALPLQAQIPDGKNKQFTNTAPEQTWVQKGYTARLQVALADPDQNLADAFPPLPWDPYLHVIYTNQEVHLVQPGFTNNTQVVNAAYDATSPLLGFDLPLAQAFNAHWQWPQEFLGIWRVYPDYVANAISDGAQNPAWWDPNVATTYLEYAWQGGAVSVSAAELSQGTALSSRYYASPVVADLDGDGQPEIIIGNLVKWQLEVYDVNGVMRAGWPKVLHEGVKAAAAVGDLDGDGKLEIVVGDMRGYLYAYRANGEALPGWPIRTGTNPDAGYRILSRPAVVNLDGSGAAEVVLALSDGNLYVYEANGALRNGWPVSLGAAADTYGNHVVDSSPVVADIDGDGKNEIVVGSYDGSLYVYRADGTLAWKYATGDVIMGTPVVGELAAGSPGLEIVIGSGDRFVYLLSSTGELLWRRPTGWIVRSSPLLADLNNDGVPEIIIGSDDHKVWAWHNNGERVAGWPQSTGAAVTSSPVAGDVDGDGQIEIVVGSDDAKVYAWNGDGTPAEGWPKDAGYPVKSAPALLNADGDAELEALAAGYEGVLRFLGVPVNQKLFLPVIGR